MSHRQMADEARFVGDDLTGVSAGPGQISLDIFFGERDAKVCSFGNR